MKNIPNNLLEYYERYIRRADTYEDFIDDVHLLGGTFFGGFIDTKKGIATIKDKDFNLVQKVKLKEVRKYYILLQKGKLLIKKKQI